MRRKELEIVLQSLPGNPKPIPGLEQVQTPAAIASDALYAAHALGSLEGMHVADLGCGTGILAIGAALLGAVSVTALDIDKQAMALGQRFAEEKGLSIRWINGDVSSFAAAVDTIIMNPPFGAQKKHADRPFLEAAMRCSATAYTFCLETTVPFIEEFSRDLGWACVSVRTYKFPIPYTHPFHKKERKVFDVAFLRLSSEEEKRGSAIQARKRI